MSRMRDVEGAYDAIVVGARVAGAATAMLLARSGLRVLAVDRAREGSDTVSTHALMRGGVVQLHRWGLLERVVAAGTPAITSATFRYGDEEIRVPIEPQEGADALRAPRRTVLDPLLVDAARAAGAQVLHETRLVDLERDVEGRVLGATLAAADGETRVVAAGIVIGADGIRSDVARRVNAAVEREARHAAGVIYGYWPGLALDGYHWYYREGLALGGIPTNDGLTCVFLSMPAERFMAERGGRLPEVYRRVLAEADPELARAIAPFEPVGPMRAFPGQRGFIRRSWGPGWALVGDAGYFKDPLTAHGITDALRDAELLARAVTRGGAAALAEYQATRDALAVECLEITDAIASFDWTLASVQPLHRRFSKHMARELPVIWALDEAPARSVAAR